ncbi:hypothetical protein GSI_04059 [Ganoderma sinense ZZ0214-1]|uniref:Uncharacterized protein n=1 Tax=Ganoderma sinense ZZ0214-1 TaxID=1077348 RepID=A0A2G8SI86_9APHY|nr:hypothetical protein GSI_04059 [Ganoderma sinense ZZ0214-1]
MSSTTSASPSSTTTSSDGNSSGGTFFSSGGSTLILAFLAIGLFVGGLLVMFSMRRYVSTNRRRMRAWQTTGERSWGWDAAAIGLPATMLMDMNSSRGRKDFGKKPELWDVRVGATSRTLVGEWEKATPIAARSLYAPPNPSSFARSSNPTTSSSISPSPPPGSNYLRPFQIGLRDTRAQIASLHIPWLRQASNISSPRSSTQRLVDATPRPSGIGAEELTAPRAEVAIAIAFPSQSPCAPGCVPLFALGVTNVRWAGELSTLDGSTDSSPSPPPRYTH